ncbi:HAD-IB family phosphatase [Chloroflexota bacterium]
MTHSTEVVKTLIQCDFDGTITQEDVSFLLLEAFADGDWRQLVTDYSKSKIPVGYFSTNAFAMIKADKQTLLNFIKGKVQIRAGFNELLSYCHRWGFQFVIVSNGLDFYIERILRDIGMESIKAFAAQAQFCPEGIQVKYIGPGGRQLQDGFKEAYVKSFLRRGDRVIYVGNGSSDLLPAKLAHHIFATDNLIDSCKEINLNCIPFVDLNDVVKGLELLDGDTSLKR